MTQRTNVNLYAGPNPLHPSGRQLNTQPRTTQARHPTSFRPSGVWSAADDAQLKDARARSSNWAEISRKYFPSKTPNACRKRHERLMERASTDEWDGIKLEALAEEYCRVREAMWRILGERLNEKWTVIEAKCMEKGVKTLLAVQRQVEKQRMTNIEGSNVSDDSGVALEDGEYELDQPVKISRREARMSGNHRHREQISSMHMLQPLQGTVTHEVRNTYLPIASMLGPTHSGF